MSHWGKQWLENAAWKKQILWPCRMNFVALKTRTRSAATYSELPSSKYLWFMVIKSNNMQSVCCQHVITVAWRQVTSNQQFHVGTFFFPLNPTQQLFPLCKRTSWLEPHVCVSMTGCKHWWYSPLLMMQCFGLLDVNCRKKTDISADFHPFF